MSANEPILADQIRALPSFNRKEGYLYGPMVDFFLLGGGTCIALIAFRVLIGGGEAARTWSVSAALGMAMVINNPHFAHSYQIFYRGLAAKLRGPEIDRSLRMRLIFVGILAPIILTAFLAGSIYYKNVAALGLTANLMFFLVGWHYVKQGYGMAMVDAALKKAFYNETEKRCLLLNAYTVWIFSWLFVNSLANPDKTEYFGIYYLALPVSDASLALAGSLAALTTTATIALLVRRSCSPRPIAWNGILSYGVSLYPWLLVRDPIFLLFVPMLHSLQYIAVVWRFQINKINSERSSANAFLKFALFVTIGIGLGYAGFWLAPQWLDQHVPYDAEIFGGSLFLFTFWIFINIHHYLLDTALWRKGNPDVARHLFGAMPTKAP